MSNWKKRPLTPSVKKLGIKFATRNVTDLQSGVDLLRDNLSGSMQEGFRLAFESIDAVRAAKGGDRLGSDEDIAETILEEIEKRMTLTNPPE